MDKNIIKLSSRKGFTPDRTECASKTVSHIFQTHGVSGNCFSRMDISVKENQILEPGELLACCDFVKVTAPAKLKIKTLFPLTFEVLDADTGAEFPGRHQLSAKDHVDQLNSCGFLTEVRQLPFGHLPDGQLPEKIFVDGLDKGWWQKVPVTDAAMLKKGMNFLSRIAPVNLLVSRTVLPEPVKEDFLKEDLKIVEVSGLFPVSTVSFVVNRLCPVLSTGTVYWSVSMSAVQRLGQALVSGFFPATRSSFLSGPAAGGGVMLTSVCGAPAAGLRQLVQNEGIAGSNDGPASVRMIDGHPLAGRILHENDFTGWTGENVCLLPDFLRPRFLGWINPLNPQASMHGGVFAKLLNQRKKLWNTNLNGSKRNFIALDFFNRVWPYRIPFMPLMRAIIKDDKEECLALGILDLLPESAALAEFADPCKNPVTQMISGMLEQLRAAAFSPAPGQGSRNV